MGRRRNSNPDWKQFEQLVSRIETDAGPRMAQKIDDDSAENWVTLEEMDRRLST